MATAVLLKSESADYYLFAKDDVELRSVEDFIHLLQQEWFISEDLYLECISSEKFDSSDINKAVQDLLDNK